MTGVIYLKLRDLGRVLKLNKLINTIIGSAYYEEKFGNKMLDNINNGDVVWDVGANVGFYTEKFLSKVSKSGVVVAFEPSPGSIDKLKDVFENNSNVHIKPIALGECDGEIDMIFGDEPTSVTNRVASIGEEKDTQKVQIRSGDSFVADNNELLPNVIKIDVEGHELSVIKGMRKTLLNKNLRCIAIEIHFEILKNRGEGFAPREIVEILKENGYSISWTDPSHVVAIKK
jgi:FkbM family methyltransferase